MKQKQKQIERIYSLTVEAVEMLELQQKYWTLSSHSLYSGNNYQGLNFQLIV